MFAKRLRRYKGLITLISSLVGFILIVVGGGAWIDANIIQRETFARAKTVNFSDMLLRFGAENQQLRDDINTHLLMFRDGGRLATPFGPAWDYPPVTTQAFLDELDKVLYTYDSGDVDLFEEAYYQFDRTYADIALGRQRILVTVQYLSAGIVFLGFLGVLSLLFFRLGKADDEAQEVRSENEHILASTNDGMFLIDDDFRIGTQQSTALRQIFGESHSIEGDFFQFIEPYLDSAGMRSAEKFVGLLFSGHVKQKLMGDLNPLRELPVVSERRSGASMKKYINMDFSRDATKEDATRLLVTVSDVTKEVLLREELEATRELQNERLELLTQVLHVESGQLKRFFQQCSQAYLSMNEILSEEASDHESNVEKLARISRTAHRVKGDAAALKLPLFETSLHRFEDAIAELHKRIEIDGQSMLELTVQLKNMIAEMELAQSITSQFKHHTNQQPAATIGQTAPQASADSDSDSKTVSGSVEERLTALAETVAGREGKQVKLITSGLQALDEEGSLQQTLYDISVQLLRNSIVHGIEKPVLRAAKSKPEQGEVKVTVEKIKGGDLQLTVADDGQGLQFEAIQRKALAKGLLKEDNAQDLDRRQLLKFIFAPGFSSLDDTSEDGGRGVGLDLVREQLTAIGGKISVSSVDDKSSQFKVLVPAA